MKRVIKNQKKMKNAMYIVFGAFALALFAITRMHPSYANEGLMIDDALDAIVLYGEVETATEDENVYESQDEEEEISEVENEGDEYFHEVPDDEENMDVDEDEINVDVDGETIDSDNINNNENEQEEKLENEKENEQQPEIQNPEVPSIEDNHGVDDKTSENDLVEDDNIQDEDSSKTNGYEQSEIGGFIKNPENDILELGDNEVLEIESEEIYGSGEYEGVKVEVYAQTGAFPKGTILSIVPITGDNEISDIQDVLEEQKNVEKTEKLIAFDITFLDPDTEEELQPLTGTVQVSFNYEENEELKAAEENEEQEVKVYHLNDKDEEGEKVEEIKDTLVEDVVVNEEKSGENMIVVDANKFSIYMVGNVGLNLASLGDIITYSYNANGGTFEGGDNVKNIVYNYSEPTEGTKYSHTPNISDAGVKNEDYGNGLNINEVITINGAEKLDITIIYGGESESRDWACMWEGSHPNYTAESNYKTSVTGKLGGGNHTNSSNTKTFTVRGDTVTFAFKSDSSGCGDGYGYYAIIKGIGGYSTNEIIENPTRNGYGFAGWFESGSTELFDFNQDVTQNRNLYAKWDENVHIKYNANGGYFDDGNMTNEIDVEYSLQSNGKYTPNINLQFPDRIPENMNQQSGWMFAGWYTTEGEANNQTIEFIKVDETTEKNMKVYAKWLPFNDFPIMNGEEILFIIMDRNLGATEIFNQNFENPNVESYGYYYQWGNNYGFSSDSNSVIETSEDGIDASDNGPGNYYSNNVFIKRSSWDSSNNKNLWGGSGDDKLIRGDGTDENRQGPCPEGYHVPSALEWEYAYSTWSNLSTRSQDLDHLAKNFGYDFMLPFAGTRSYNDASISNQGSSVAYWSSSPRDNSDYASHYMVFGNTTNPFVNSMDRTRGFPIRCFKNSSDTTKKVMFLTETGHKISEYNLIRWEPINSSYKPEDPIKQGYEFIGRYESGNNEEYDFSQERVSDLILYEKWATRDGLEEGNIAKLLDGKRFNSVIKSLVAGDIISYEKQDTLIQGIEKSLILPEGGRKRLISSEDSESQIFAWFDEQEKRIKYYTKAETIYLNEDSSYMFYNIRNLKPFNLDGFKFDYVTNMERMFAYSFSSAEGITLDFRNTDLTNVTNMKQAFEGCFQRADTISGVTIDFRNTDLSNVTNMYHMFDGIFRESNIINGITIDFRNADLSNVTDMEGMFEYSIKQAGKISNIVIDFSGAKLGNVKTMKYMFNSMFQNVSNEISGIRINLNNIDLKNIEDMSSMFAYSFEYNNNIQSISGVSINLSNSLIDHNVQVLDVFSYIFNSNYGGNINSVVIDLSHTSLKGWNDMSSTFRGSFRYNGSLSGVKIDFTDANLSETTTMNNMFEDAFSQITNEMNGITIDFSNVDANKLTSMYRMLYDSFRNVGGENGITIKFSNMKLNGLTNMSQMFYQSFQSVGSLSGVKIDFDDVDLKNVETMYQMFDCAFEYVRNVNGISIDFSNQNFEKLATMENMFYYAFWGAGNVNGVIIDFSNSNLGNVTNVNRMFHQIFYNCTSVSGVTIDFTNVDLSKLISTEQMFSYGFYNSPKANLLSNITIDFSGADLSSVTNVYEMFYAALQSANIMTGVTIDFTNVDLSNLKNTKWMFAYTLRYVDTMDGVMIDLSNADLSNVTSTKEMFYQTFDSVTNVGTTVINFDNINMHNVTDMYGMFYRNDGLTWLDLSSLDTSNVTDMTYMFYSCTNLTGLDLSSWDTSNLTKMPYMFQDNYKLKTIYVGSRFRTNNVTDSSVMFQNATSLVGGRGTTYNSSNPRDKTYARIDKIGEPGYFTKKSEGTVATLLPGQDFNAKIKTIAKGSDASYSDTDIYIKKIKEGKKEQVLMKMLEGNNLEKISTTYSEVPVYARYSDSDKTLYYYSEADEIDMNVNAVNMFSNLTKLEEVELEGIKTSSVSNMVSMFQNDTSLTGLDLSNFDASSVTNMQNMFNGCSGIKSINLSNANMSRVTNISGIFGGCSSLEIVDFSNADMRSLTSFASIFPVLPKLREVNFHKVNLSSLESTSGMFGGISSLKYADFSDANLKSVQSVVSMFGGSGLTGADFSNANLRSVQSSSSMFGGIGTLLMANFENTNMMNVTDMSSMFGGCNNLNRVIFSGANIGNVTSVYSMFGGDSKLETVDFTKVNLSKLENMSQMFGGCSGLTGMDFSKMDLSRVTNMNGLFSAALKLESVNFGDNDFKSVTNMRSLFQNCTSLEELDITKFDTSNVTNMSEMFKGAAKLKTIYVGDEFKTDSVTNSTDMFSGAVSVVGGNGTVYDENYIDKEYARVDKSGTPGYFTLGEFSIIYNLDGGDMEDMKINYKLGESFIIGQPTRNEAVFMGWTGSNGTIPELIIEIQKGTAGDLEYTANWEINQYKIIFNTDGGNEINPISVDYNSLLSGLNLPTPTKECNEFMGWSIELPERMPAHDITLKAVWNYTCSKSSGGGGGGGGGSVKSESEKEDIHNSAEENPEVLPKEDKTEQNNINEENLNQNILIEENREVVPIKKPEIENKTTGALMSNGSNYTSEQKEAYDFAKANGITTTSSIEEAKMNTSLTRIEMAKMMSYFAINVLGKEPDVTKTANFKDVSKKKDEQYDNGVTLAYQLGIMGQNMKNNKFRPNDEVTRAEFATALSRLLYSTPEGEYKGTRKYYEPHIAKLYNEGIISKTDPEIKEKRGYVMTMFMRSVK